MAQTFSWNHPELNEGAFTAFAALLRLRAGGVPTMQSSTDGSTLATNVIEGNQEDDGDDDDDDDKAASIHTDRNDRLYHVPYNEKAEFLDSMAELAANKKGKQAVAASVMWEREEDVIIWVAKNRGFQKEEELFFSQMADLLSGIASASKNGKHTSTSSQECKHSSSRCGNFKSERSVMACHAGPLSNPTKYLHREPGGSFFWPLSHGYARPKRYIRFCSRLSRHVTENQRPVRRVSRVRQVRPLLRTTCP